MKRSLISAVTALALMVGVSCTPGAGNRPLSKNEGTTRTANSAGIANGNHQGSPASDRDRSCINLNTASAEDLTLLPGIGPGFARKIIEYRNKYGPFQRPQDVIIIDGFGERRYHKIERYICT